MSVPDAEILRASVHDPTRFEAIFDRHHGFVWSYLARRAGSTVADDLTGEVLLQAFAHRDRYDPTQGTVRAWLCGIAANQLRTRFRTQARAKRAFERVAWQRAVADAGPEGAGDRVALHADLTKVVRALGEVPTVDREVVTLFAWEQLTYEEIAAVMGCEIGTVRSRLSRARARLRELVGPIGEEQTDPVVTTEATPDG